MNYLKLKIDAGVDFLITQIFFSSETFLKFMENCRTHQIKVPIIPGIYVPSSFEELMRIIKITNINVPDDILRAHEFRNRSEIHFRRAFFPIFF